VQQTHDPEVETHTKLAHLLIKQHFEPWLLQSLAMNDSKELENISPYGFARSTVKSTPLSKDDIQK
jgi:hypothetical protein